MLFGLDLTQLIEVLGYPGIFAVILAESGLFFAVSLPGGSLLFTAGLIASQGYLNIYILVSLVVVAAVLGDSIGYWFGSWVGPALWKRPDSRFFKRAYLEQTRSFFDEHGSKAILLARFIPIVRTFAPILAGVAQMNYRTFLTYNALGAVIWGGGFVMAGYLLGETVPSIEEYLEFIVIGIIVVTLIPFFLHLWKARRSEPKVQPKAIMFDLDDTLSESFTPPTDDILGKLRTLARIVPIAISSGAAFERVKRDVLDRMTPFADSKGFYVFTDNAAQCWKWNGTEWEETFSYPISDQEQEEIARVIREVVRESGVFDNESDQSDISRRHASVAFHALPVDATQLEKRDWDSDSAKRMKITSILKKKLPEYEVMIAGKTTIDVTRQGINKAYGVEWWAKEIGIEPRAILFVGDSFYTGGNDAVVIPTGVRILETSGPTETSRIIDDLIAKYR